MQIPSGYPLVSLRIDHAGEVIKIVFKDRSGKTRTPSSLTRDSEAAKKLAEKLSFVLVNKLFDDPPADTPKIILDWLGIRPLTNRMVDDLTENWFSYKAPMTIVDHQKEFLNLIIYYGQLNKHARSLKARLDDAERELYDAKTQLRNLTDEVAAFRAHATAEGLAIADSVKPVSLSQAWKNFIGEGDGDAGTRSGDRFKKTIKNVLKAFAKKLGESRLVSEVMPGEVIEYLRGLDVQPTTLTQYTTGMILPMLEHSSGGLYRSGAVRLWLEKENARQSKSKVEADWYWLSPTEVEKFFEIAAITVGEYWADAMTIQYYLGLRPEELPMLQAKNVMRKGRAISHVYVEPLKHGTVLVRRLKTPDSEASVPVTVKACKESLARRVSRGHALLFPRDHTECGGRRTQWHRRKVAASEHERSLMLWQATKWDKEYLEKLREVIAKVQSIDKDRFDGRSLRRTRGKDLVVQTKSLESAAAFLRDKPSTVERHYAKLLPRDFADLK